MGSRIWGKEFSPIKIFVSIQSNFFELTQANDATTFGTMTLGILTLSAMDSMKLSAWASLSITSCGYSALWHYGIMIICTIDYIKTLSSSNTQYNIMLTFDTMTLGIPTLSAIDCISMVCAFITMTLGATILSVIDSIKTLSLNNTQHNIMLTFCPTTLDFWLSVQWTTLRHSAWTALSITSCGYLAPWHLV